MGDGLDLFDTFGGIGQPGIALKRPNEIVTQRIIGPEFFELGLQSLQQELIDCCTKPCLAPCYRSVGHRKHLSQEMKDNSLVNNLTRELMSRLGRRHSDIVSA